MTCSQIYEIKKDAEMMINIQIRRDLQARRAAAEICLRTEATENLAIK